MRGTVLHSPGEETEQNSYFVRVGWAGTTEEQYSDREQPPVKRIRTETFTQ